MYNTGGLHSTSFFQEKHLVMFGARPKQAPPHCTQRVYSQYCAQGPEFPTEVNTPVCAVEPVPSPRAPQHLQMCGAY